MKLYDLKRGDWFMLVEDCKAPPDIGGYAAGTYFRFSHVDGMYSYCTDGDGNVYHPVAWAEVTQITPE
jgi:hypothetical protein